VTVTSEREDAWNELYDEVKTRIEGAQLDGPWEVGHRKAIQDVDDPVDLVVRLIGYSAGLAVHGRDNGFVRQKIGDALSLIVKYG
jgi:hypothetical protein